MEKKIAGLVGAIAALGVLDTAVAAPASAAPVPSLTANSFAELLEPIPNAAQVLRTMDTQAPAADDGLVQKVQYHHHHHHHWHRRHYHHHHHHHHHHYY